MGSIEMAAALAVLTLASLGAQTLPAGDEASQASLHRIRAALERPAPRQLGLSELPPASNEPTFRMQVVEERSFERNIPLPWHAEPMPRPLQLIPPGPFGTQPLVTVDLIWLSGAVVHGTVGRARARAAAREVHQAIRDYCDAQPNGGAGIRICSP